MEDIGAPLLEAEAHPLAVDEEEDEREANKREYSVTAAGWLGLVDPARARELPQRLSTAAADPSILSTIMAFAVAHVKGCVGFAETHRPAKLFLHAIIKNAAVKTWRRFR